MEQFGLQRGVKIPDLVEKDRAVVSCLELADLELVGTGEGASLVTEQLALQELPRHGGAVDLDEWPSPAGGEVVDRAGDELFAGAGLARDQNGDVDAGRLAKDLARLQHPGAAPELHLAAESPGHLLWSRPRRFSGRAIDGVDGPLEVVEVQRLLQHHLHPGRGRIEAVVAMVGD